MLCLVLTVSYFFTIGIAFNATFVSLFNFQSSTHRPFPHSASPEILLCERTAGIKKPSGAMVGQV